MVSCVVRGASGGREQMALSSVETSTAAASTGQPSTDVFHKVRVANVNVTWMLEVMFLVPLDHSARPLVDLRNPR